MGKKNRRKNKKPTGSCDNCQNAVACGEGMFLCLESDDEPKCVIDEYMPSDDYLWCGGKKYE